MLPARLTCETSEVTDDTRTKNQIWKDEGFRKFPYKDTVGKLTIGVGRNLDDVGLSEDEVKYLFNNDFDKARDLAALLPAWYSLNGPRKAVLVNMVFQLGLGGVSKFKKMIDALSRKDYEEAANQMLDSKWHRQTPNRAERLAIQMRTGKWVD